MKCTWKDCTQPAAHPQLSKGGSTWANLCDTHHIELEQSADLNRADFSIPKMMRAWVLAKGGAEAAARDMMHRRME